MGFDRASSSHTPIAARTARWLAVLAASVLLHGAVFTWADGSLVFPPGSAAEPTPVSVALLAPPPPPPPARPVTAARPKPRPRPRPKPVQPAPSELAQAPAPVDARAETVVEQGSDEAVAAIDSGTDSDTPPLADVMPVLDEIEPAPLPQPVNPPPSVELHYDVYALRDQQNWHGKGLFRWESDGDTYRLTGEASINFLFNITVLNFSSEGVINEFGVAPVLYSEKPWRKSMTNTHFQHAQQKISFSASTASYPYYGGDQDRASILWQLAGIGRGAPERFYPGAEIEVFVAGTRDATPWHIGVIGQEAIDTPLGSLQTWRVARTRRSGSYDQRVDVWLAPEQHWYPVKVRYTYANGDHLDLSLSELTPVAATEPNRMEQ